MMNFFYNDWQDRKLVKSPCHESASFNPKKLMFNPPELASDKSL